MEWNTVEGATKAEIDTGTEYKGVGKVGCFMSLTRTVTSPPHKAEPAGWRGPTPRDHTCPRGTNGPFLVNI